jgi:pre-mRNA-splicing factor ATP-dependent RNA helicase DHX38/PRP16
VVQNQVDADTAVVGDQGEIDFKEEAKFSQHLQEKSEAVSDFAKSKSLAQQRQYLPIYTVRDDLLQVCTWLFGLVMTVLVMS